MFITFSCDAAVLYHADSVGQDMVYPQVCRLNLPITLSSISGFI
jgi:hypothetical protein